jgi:hypothetical protein
MTISLDQLTGSWKLMEVWHEFDISQCRYPYGSDAVGSLVFTDDNRIVSIIIAGTSFAHAPGYAMEAYSGRFTLDGSEMITTIDVSSRPEWKGRDQRRFLSFLRSRDIDVLFVTSPKQIGSLYSGVPFTTALKWFRRRPVKTRSCGQL